MSYEEYWKTVNTFDERAGAFYDGKCSGKYVIDEDEGVFHHARIVFSHKNLQPGSCEKISWDKQCVQWQICTGTWGGMAGEVQVLYRRSTASVTSAKATLRSLYTCLGGSVGFIDVEYFLSSGHTKGDNMSDKVASEVKITATASAKKGIAKVGGLIEKTVSDQMERNLTFTNKKLEEKRMTIRIDFSQPCYIYQWGYDIHQSDGANYDVFAGSIIQSPSPLPYF